MNATLSTTPGRHDHPPSYLERRTVRDVGPLDRFALHLGVALIRWGRRPRAATTREQRIQRYEQFVSRIAREQEAERAFRLRMPLR